MYVHKRHYSFLFFLTLVLLVGITSYSSRTVIGNQFVMTNVFVADFEIGGKTYSEAGESLADRYGTYLQQPVTVAFRDKQYTTTLANLGVELDTYKTVENAYKVTHGDSIVDHFVNRVKSLFQDQKVEPVYSFDKEKFISEIRSLVPNIRLPSDASVIVGKDGRVKVLAHNEGLRVDFQPLYDEVEQYVAQLAVPRIHVEGETLQPSYTAKEANDDADALKALLYEELTFRYDGDAEPFTFVTHLKSDWLSVKNGEVAFYEDAIQTYIQEKIASQLDITSQNAVLKSLPAEGSPYAIVDGAVKHGRKLDVDSATKSVIEAINSEERTIALKVDVVEGKIINETSADLGNLQFLAQGHSNFEGSPEGRAFNIAKGLEERMNNILLAPGEEFKYNSYLGPVTSSNGWKDSLAIFGGSVLSPVPGGGLCQVSTTMYRAALNAGLEIFEKANHSLYVHYYRAFGDGLDSTIYPGQRDLRFKNDTGNYLLIQAYVDGDDAYVDFYGTPDGREVELIGPFYSYSEIPEEYKADLGNVAWNQIKWLQKIRRKDGTSQTNLLTSTYRTAPRATGY